jgi:hypothetical protein
MAKKLKYISHQRNILEETIKNCNIVIRVNIDIINIIAIIEEKIEKEKKLYNIKNLIDISNTPLRKHINAKIKKIDYEIKKNMQYQKNLNCKIDKKYKHLYPTEEYFDKLRYLSDEL